MSTNYFKLLDVNQIAKMENGTPYLFQGKKGWVIDDANLLTDRMMGYGDCSVFDYENISLDEVQNEIAKITN